MRRLILCFTIILCSSSFAQLEHEPKIIDFLGQARFNQILASNPAYLDFLNTRIQSGFAVVDNVDGKFNSMNVLTVLPYRIDQGEGKDTTGVCKNGIVKETDSPEEFLQKYENGSLNILKYILSYDSKDVTYYQLGETGKVLVIYPTTYINNLIEKNK